MADAETGYNDQDGVILGIDIGGSGIKGAPVDVERGEMLTDRKRYKTPHPATPEAVAKTVRKLTRYFKWQGPVGAAFPAIVRKGVVHSAANIDEDWIGTNARELFANETGCDVRVLNDADAAGNAEMQLGAGRDVAGTVIVLTLGTGIGSAIYIDGHLVPNTELGHLIFHDKDAEDYAADRVRKDKKLSWKKWGKRLDAYLNHLDFLFSPDLIIIGGGVSKKSEHYFKYFDVDAPIVPAEMLNEAGIVGAALSAADLLD